MPGTVPLLAALALLALPTAALARDAVDLALVLAVDISGSIDSEEAAQQREGYVAAIADPQVIAAIRSTATGRIALTYVEWSGADSQQVVIPWTVIDGAPAAEAFAGRLAETPTHRRHVDLDQRRRSTSRSRSSGSPASTRSGAPSTSRATAPTTAAAP